MPSALEKQVQELKEAGYPVRTGIRQVASENGEDTKGRANNLWIHRWAKHAAQNYPIVSRSTGVRFLADSAVGVPVFIVGIGPSLDENILELREAHGRALILATDAAYRVLRAHDIMPDMVMSFDCQRQQSSLWDTAETAGVPLICNSCTHPDTIEAWKGPILFFNQWHTSNDFIQRLLPYIYPHLGQLPSVGTVGNELVVLAKHMGCGPIFTVGMDLCYRAKEDGWKYRCTDYRLNQNSVPWPPTDSLWKKTENKILYNNDSRVANSHDEEIADVTYRTDRELKVYRESLLVMCESLQIKLIDCSPGGLLKSYFRQISVSKAIDEYCQAELGGGRTVVQHLGKLIDDGKKKWRDDRLAGLIS